MAHIDEIWGKEVLHVWDRGFAGNPWLTQAFLHGACFVMRWPKNYCLLDEQGELRKPGNIASCGMPEGGVNARPVSSPSPSSIPPTTNPSGWWSLGARDNRPGIYSPTSLLIPLPSPGRSSWPMPAAGRSRCPFATISPNWPSRAPDSTPGPLATNSSSWPHSLIPSSFLSCR